MAEVSCPKCGAELLAEGGLFTCPSCGAVYLREERDPSWPGSRLPRKKLPQVVYRIRSAAERLAPVDAEHVGVIYSKYSEISGRCGMEVAAAALLVASRQIGRPIAISELCRAIEDSVGVSLSKRRVALTAADMARVLRIDPPVDLKDYVDLVMRRVYVSKVPSELEERYSLDPERVLERVRLRAYRIASRISGRPELAGKSPLITAAAVVYIAARSLGLRMLTQRVLSETLYTHPSAIRRRVRQLNSMLSGGLS